MMAWARDGRDSRHAVQNGRYAASHKYHQSRPSVDAVLERKSECDAKYLDGHRSPWFWSLEGVGDGICCASGVDYAGRVGSASGVCIGK